jgi:HAD superfamily hydrolase (TIGR01509 family)
LDLRLQGVIFDMDGVLCDSEEFICKAAVEMFRQNHGAKVRPEDFIPFVGAGENRYLGGVAEKYGLELRLERDKARTYELYLEMIQGNLQPLAGVTDFIRDARKAGLKLAVATSADEVKMTGNLRQIGLGIEAFDVCINGLEVEHKKPHPEIFDKAAGALGLTGPDCLVVEDAPNGVQAAKAASCLCLGLTTSFSPGQLRRAGADWIAQDLSRVDQELRDRLGM